MCVGVYVFFFKQKTADEMRISDWSSDVCSSDLGYALGCADIGRTRAWLEGQGLACADTGRGAIRVAPPAALGGTLVRSETRRVGNECVSTCRSRLSQSH